MLTTDEINQITNKADNLFNLLCRCHRCGKILERRTTVKICIKCYGNLALSETLRREARKELKY